MLDVDFNPGRRELRQFSLVWLPLFAAGVGGLILYRGGGWTVPAVLWGVAIVVAGTGLARPEFVRPLFVGWLAAAYPIGSVVSHLVLAATFYLVVTPIGLLLRLFGREPLGRRRHGSPGSYWVPHQPPNDHASYFKQF